MSYQLDPTGISPENKIIDEVKVVTPPARITDANFVVPNQTPFFKEGLVVKLGSRILVEGHDYQLIFRHIAASTHFERELFGGIMFINKQFTGTINITYQTLGGEFANSDPNRITEFAKTLGKVRWVSLDQIIGVPSGFPPAYHTHDIEEDLVDMGDVVDAVEKIVTAINNIDVGAMGRALLQHLNSPSAHNKSSVGLGNVLNYPIASLEEMKRGVSGRYVTPDVVTAWMRSLNPEDLNVDLSGINNTIKTLTSDISKLKETISRLPNERTLSEWISSLSRDMQNRFNNFLENLHRNRDFEAAVKAIYNAIPDKVTVSQIEAIQRKIATIERNVNGYTDQIRDVRDSLIATLEESVRGINTNISGINTTISDIKKTIEGLRTGTENNSGSILQLTNSLSDLTTNLNNLKSTSTIYPHGVTGEVHNGRNVAYRIDFRLNRKVIEERDDNVISGRHRYTYYEEIRGVTITKYGKNPELRHHDSLFVDWDFKGVVIDRMPWFKMEVSQIHDPNNVFMFTSDRDPRKVRLIRPGEARTGLLKGYEGLNNREHVYTVYIYGE